MEQGISVKINDPYYSQEEIRRIAGVDSFNFPEGLSEFECILIVAGHRAYRAVSEMKLKPLLKNCKLIIDNLEETWKNFDWQSTETRYLTAGEKDWLR
jgi:UDP-N-acetyl-D-mannosaminuronate dehydrogenase